MGFFFPFFRYLCVHSHVHIYTMHSVDIENKKRRNKNTFKERVKFPILECTVEIRETKHSTIVVESSGSVVIVVIHLVYARYVVSLRLVSLVQGKPMKSCLLLSFSLCFASQVSEDINVKSNILARCAILRHEWCFIRKPVEGALMLPLVSCLKGGTRMAKHAEFLP